MVKQLRPVGRAAAIAAALAVVVGVFAPAVALPPTKRIVNDAVEPGKGYDIVRVVLRSSPDGKKPAVVVVRHGRDVQVGDSIDIWFNLDDDKQPDVHVAGDSFSEYSVTRTDSFDEDGKDITKRGCFALSMAGDRSKVKFDPNCLGHSLKYGVSVKSFRSGRPASAADWVRAPEKFTRKVLSQPLS